MRSRLSSGTAPSYVPPSRFLRAFGRRPPNTRRRPSRGRHPKPFATTDVDATSASRDKKRGSRHGWSKLSFSFWWGCLTAGAGISERGMASLQRSAAKDSVWPTSLLRDRRHYGHTWKFNNEPVAASSTQRRNKHRAGLRLKQRVVLSPSTPRAGILRSNTSLAIVSSWMSKRIRPLRAGGA